jgi:hypothetical protein
MEHQSTYDPSLVTNTDFLSELAQAAPDGSCLWVNRFHGDPNPDSPWGGMVYTPSDHEREMCDSWGDYNTYFSVAAVQIGPDGRYHRRRDNFARMLCLVIDDVELESLLSPPSWVLETSPGKTQAGYFLDGEDPDCANELLCTSVVRGMMMRGLVGGDKSGNNSVRYVRLPLGTNQKPRATGHVGHKLRVWRPSIRLTLEDACGAIGLDLDSFKSNAYQMTAEQAAGTIAQSAPQDEKLRAATKMVMEGHFHEPLNIISSSMIASGAHPAAVTNMLRGLMDAYPGAHDKRWEDRVKDIPRCVRDAERKFKPDQQPIALPMVLDAETGELVQPTREPLFEHVGEKMGTLRRPQWVIERYIEWDGLSVLFGPSGVGKSFVVISMACCVATGTPWFGMPVRKGPVFYIAGEGHNGLMRRFKAWSVESGVSLADAPLYKSRKAVQILDAESAAVLREEIERMTRQYGEPVMIIIDTLARNFGDGDENAAKDIGRYVAVLDEIRAQYKCHIMSVHHSGHNQDRARGSSALKAAMDQEIGVAGVAGHIAMKVTKMKDEETPIPKMFKLKQMIIGTDDIGEEVKGAALVADGDPMDVEIGSNVAGKVVTARMLVDSMRQHGWQGYEVLQMNFGVGYTTARRMVERCVTDLGYLQKDGKGFALTDKALEDPMTVIDQKIDKALGMD